MPRKKNLNSTKGRRLLVPVKIGRSRKTTIFVPIGTRVTTDNVARIVNQSSYFLKPKPDAFRVHLREELRKAGILFEKPMETLNGGVELFARGSFRSLREGTYSRIKKSYITDPTKVARQMFDIIIRMHQLGIIHSHPHWQNFVVNKEQRVKIIDSKLLSRVSTPPMSKELFIQNYASDIHDSAEAIALVLHPEIMAEHYSANYIAAEKKIREIMQQLIDAHKKFTNTFGVTAIDIEHECEMRRHI